MSIFQNNLTELAWAHDLEIFLNILIIILKLLDNFKK